MQNLLRLIYPPQCISCDSMVDQEFFLCGECWKDTPFINGLICDQCGVALPGSDSGVDEYCDDCRAIDRPWQQGRAALIYRGNARRIVLAIKHGDRLDLIRPAAGWMAQVAGPIVTPDMLILPVPAHRWRFLRRGYNQAALLAQALAGQLGLPVLPDGLIRPQSTRIQDGMGRDARFENMTGAITAHPKQAPRLAGRNILLIDDVMTSGATLGSAAEACHAAGAERVSVLVLARVAKDA